MRLCQADFHEADLLLVLLERDEDILCGYRKITVFTEAGKLEVLGLTEQVAEALSEKRPWSSAFLSFFQASLVLQYFEFSINCCPYQKLSDLFFYYCCDDAYSARDSY